MKTKKLKRWSLANLITGYVMMGLFILLVISVLCSSELKFYENSYAVIIGINNYQSEDITDLGYAVEDAQSIFDLLTNKLNFKRENVYLITDNDATRDIPIIVITSKDLTEEDYSYLTANVDQVIQKGKYTRKELIKRIDKAIKESNVL